jgi:hypothetical protein
VSLQNSLNAGVELSGTQALRRGGIAGRPSQDDRANER